MLPAAVLGGEPAVELGGATVLSAVSLGGVTVLPVAFFGGEPILIAIELGGAPVLSAVSLGGAAFLSALLELGETGELEGIAVLHPLVLGVVIITSVVLEGPPVLVAVVLVSKAV